MVKKINIKELNVTHPVVHSPAFETFWQSGLPDELTPCKSAAFDIAYQGKNFEKSQICVHTYLGTQTYRSVDEPGYPTTGQFLLPQLTRNFIKRKFNLPWNLWKWLWFFKILSTFRIWTTKTFYFFNIKIID